MRQTARCPSCGNTFEANDDEVALRVCCPACRPAGDGPVEVSLLDAEPQPPEVVVLEEEPRRRSRTRPAADRPAMSDRVARWGGKQAVGAVLGPSLMGLLFGPLVGGYLLYYQVKNDVLFGGGRWEAQELSCADLCEKGPGDNPHVILTDFRLETDRIARDQKPFETKKWEKAWVQAVPADSEKGTQPVRVLVEFGEHTNPDYVEKVRKEGRVKGVLRRGMPVLTTGDVGRTFPGTDFDDCWVLEEGETPGGNVLVSVGAVVLIVLGLLFWALIGFFVWLYFTQDDSQKPSPQATGAG